MASSVHQAKKYIMHIIWYLLYVAILIWVVMAN